MGEKQQAVEAGELAERTFSEYEAVCDLIATLGKQRAIEGLTADDFNKLRRKLGRKKSGQAVSPVTHKRLLTFARMPFYYANEDLGFSIRYKKALRTA